MRPMARVSPWPFAATVLLALACDSDETKSDSKSEAKSESKPEPTVKAKPETKTETKAEAKTEAEVDTKADPEPDPEPIAASDPDAPIPIADLDEVPPIVLPAPSWEHHAIGSPAITQGPEPALAQLSKKKNKITDEEAWFLALGASLPEWEVPNPLAGTPGNAPKDVPHTFAGARLVRALDLPDYAVFIYGASFAEGRYAAVTNRKLEILGVLDFDAWTTSPATAAGAASYVDQALTWAEVVDGVLFVSHAHRTYAESSGGQNAYVSAITLATGDVLWRSDPLVSNSRNFVLHDGWIITGYGFTAEDDFIYVLDTHDGTIAKKVKVKSGPDYFVIKDGELHVRTYDTDYRFSL